MERYGNAILTEAVRPGGLIIPGALTILVVLILAGSGPSRAGEETDQPNGKESATTRPVANRPQVPGRLRLRIRTRCKEPGESGRREVVESQIEWSVSETAIIICDMWSDHPCKLAAQRVDAMAGKMNVVVSAARAHGVMIIHAPSGGGSHYARTDYRKRMQQARPAEPPQPIAGWCKLDPSKEPPLPIDDSDGGCDDPDPEPQPKFDRHQHQAIKIIGFDGVSDNGREVYNFCRQEGIKNIAIMGVHTNMCVLGRSFGIRQMCNVGMNVVLVRDLTDAMYDPRDRPYVSHARGTELVIEHIEAYWCPTIVSDDLMRVVPGSAGPVGTKSVQGN